MMLRLALALLFLPIFAHAANEVALTPHVPTNARLKTIKSTAYATVIRDGFTTAGDGGHAVYTASHSACSLNSGDGDDGSQVKAADGGCWLISQLYEYDVRIWGAQCDGSTNDTATINSALASGKSPLFIPGTCNVTNLNAPPVNTRIVGASEYTSLIRTTSATGDVLPLTNGGVIINHIGFASSVSRTGGAYVHFQASDLTLDYFYMTGAYTAYAVDDGTSIVTVDQGLIADSVGLGQDVVKYGSGTGVGPLAAYFGHTVINSATPTYTGIRIVNLGDLTLEYVQSLSATDNLAITPGNGQVVTSVSSRNSFYDHGGTNLRIAPTGTGAALRNDFANDYFGSATINSINIDGGTGSAVVDGLQFSNSRSLLAAISSGLAVQNRAKNISWNGGFISGNLVGIYDNRSSGWDGFIVNGASIGAGNGIPGNTTGIQRGNAGDYWLAQGNVVLGNTTAYINSNGGTHNRTLENPGINPIGNVVPTVGASPWTYTAGESHETYYSFGGTISSISINGTALASAAANPWSFALAPNDVVVTTYTVAPTVNVQGH